MCSPKSKWHNSSQIEAQRKLVPVRDPSRCPHAAKWDNLTVESMLRRLVWTKCLCFLLFQKPEHSCSLRSNSDVRENVVCAQLRHADNCENVLVFSA